VLRTFLRERSSAIVPLQSRGDGPPLFFVPAATGRAFYLYHLARALGGRPTYAVQPMSYRRPFESIEALSSWHVAELRRFGAGEPFLIAGHSFGGWVAYEVACRLQAAGASVPFLALLDTAAPTPELASAENRPDDAEVLVFLAEIVRSFLGREVGETTGRSFEGLDPQRVFREWGEFIGPRAVAPIWAKRLAATFEILRSSLRATYQAAARYDGRVQLFRVDEAWTEPGRSGDPADLLGMGWEEFGDGRVDTHVVSGNHVTMMTQPHVRGLAQQLAGAIDVALRIARVPSR
jgi:thioesterase domain-containing protein